MTFHQKPFNEAILAASLNMPGRRWLKRKHLAQGVWIVIALMLLVIFLANLPAFFQYAMTVCTFPDTGICPTYQLTPAYVQILDNLHLSLAVVQVFLAALCVAVSVVYWLLGLLIFWRTSGSRSACSSRCCS